MTIIVIGGENRPYFRELELMGFEPEDCEKIVDVALKIGVSPEFLGRAIYHLNPNNINIKKIIEISKSIEYLREFNSQKLNHYERVMRNRRNHVKSIERRNGKTRYRGKA